jgi:anion-transporting  ArsA/GET3 family ATPase
MNRAQNNSLEQVLSHRKILITCGTGGVGKTTLSAAMAIQAALLGRKVIVVTIDPAKRLANSLGLSTLSDVPTDLTPQLQDALQNTHSLYPFLPQTVPGTLAAVVPDTRRTFENFVKELAPSPKIAERVIQNPIFQIFAKEFSGTNEYMALERLLSLHKRSDFDCIILDTPPSRNTLAFLNAPKLLAQFFDEKMVRWLVLPANKLLAAGVKKALGILENLTGAGFMTHLFDFAASLVEVQANFTVNLKKITTLLESQQVGFLMVTTPTPETVPEVNHFLSTLQEHHFHFDGLILNRTLGHLKTEQNQSELTAPFQVLHSLQNREELVLNNLVKHPIPLCAKLPELARDVHTVEDLFHVAMAFTNHPVSSHSS